MPSAVGGKWEEPVSVLGIYVLYWSLGSMGGGVHTDFLSLSSKYVYHWKKNISNNFGFQWFFLFLRAREKKKKKAREIELMNLGLREALKEAEAETKKYKSLYLYYKGLDEGKNKPCKWFSSDFLFWWLKLVFLLFCSSLINYIKKYCRQLEHFIYTFIN